MLARQLSIEDYLEEKKEHIEVLHRDSKGWITLADIKDDKYKQWHYKYKDLLKLMTVQKVIQPSSIGGGDYLNIINSVGVNSPSEVIKNSIEDDALIGENDYYISQNTFYSTFRRIEYIKELSALYIDLDYYKTGYSKDAVLYALDQDYFKKSVPMPNLMIDSGRGIYLIWRIKAVPAQALPLWKAIEEYLYNNLKSLGADRKALDPTRILRVAGTINTRSNTRVKIIETYDYSYTLKELKEGYLPELPEKIERKSGRPKKIVSLFNTYSLYHVRIQDLEIICELRSWNLKGHREEILFLYRYWNCCFIGDTEDALRMCIELNSQFIEPLMEREVIRATKSAEKAYLSKDKQYKYKNETIIELLEITEGEQQKLKSIINNKEKNERRKIANKVKRRNEDGLTAKQAELKKLRLKIIKLKEQGFKNKEIAEKINITIKTLERHITLIKREGLL